MLETLCQQYAVVMHSVMNRLVLLAGGHASATLALSTGSSILLGQNCSFFILDLLVNLGSFGWLIAVHPCWQSGILLSGLGFSVKVLAGAVVVLGLGSVQAVTDRALIL